MIKCKRHELIESEKALATLGKTFMPIEKEQYWFIKTLSKLQKAVKQHNRQAQEKSNALLKELGKLQDNGKIGLMPTDPEMAEYTSSLEDFMQEEVEVDVEQIKLSSLQKASVTMVVEEQCALLWLIKED